VQLEVRGIAEQVVQLDIGQVPLGQASNSS
jgi:hypothetical protein